MLDIQTGIPQTMIYENIFLSFVGTVLNNTINVCSLCVLDCQKVYTIDLKIIYKITEICLTTSTELSKLFYLQIGHHNISLSVQAF